MFEKCYRFLIYSVHCSKWTNVYYCFSKIMITHVRVFENILKIHEIGKIISHLRNLDIRNFWCARVYF